MKRNKFIIFELLFYCVKVPCELNQYNIKFILVLVCDYMRLFVRKDEA